MIDFLWFSLGACIVIGLSYVLVVAPWLWMFRMLGEVINDPVPTRGPHVNVVDDVVDVKARWVEPERLSSQPTRLR